MSWRAKAVTLLLFLLFIGYSGKAQIGPVSFSPDAKSIVFSFSKGGSCFIYQADLRSGAAKRLTSSKAGCESDPAFSRDGKLIAYSYAPEGGRHSNLYLIEADGTNPRLLLEADADDVHPLFAVDGNRLYFMRSRFFGNYSPIVRPRRHDFDLLVIELSSKKVNAITQSKFYEVSAPSLAPDGKHITFVAPLSAADGDEIRVYSVVAGQEPKAKLQPHVLDEPRSGPIIAEAFFTADGKTIMFQAASNGSPTFNYDIYLISLSGGEPEALTHGIGYASGVRPSPDGKTAAFLKWNVANNTNELYMLDLATRKVRPLRLSGID